MKTITDCFEPYRGTVEYNGIVRDMITWYYGRFAQVPWCAISCSYMANELGILSQFGGKEDNVYHLMTNTEAAWKRTGKGDFRYKKSIVRGSTIPRGAVVFLLKSDPPMTAKSSKHVTTVYSPFKYTGSGKFESLGGNQDNYIKVKEYPQSQIYAIFNPDYGHSVLRKGDSGPEVKEMQDDLVAIGFGRVTGFPLLARGKFKGNTEKCLMAFQKAAGLVPDGVCGPKTWDALDKYSKTTQHTATALTNVFVRRGPGLDYKKIGKVKEGDSVVYTTLMGCWIYLPAKKGWSKTSYYNL